MLSLYDHSNIKSSHVYFRPRNWNKGTNVCHFVQMKWLKYRTAIKFHSLEVKARGIFIIACPMYMASLYCDMRQLHLGYVSLEEQGRSLEASTVLIVKIRSENIQKVHQMLLKNRKMDIKSIIRYICFFVNTVHVIFREHLSMFKVCARWVPRVLMSKMKNTQAIISTTLFITYAADLEPVHSYMVIDDEAWVHYLDPESKFESMEWKHAGSPRRKRSKSHVSSRKLW